jgi:hypothetical protein
MTLDLATGLAQRGAFVYKREIDELKGTGSRFSVRVLKQSGEASRRKCLTHRLGN